MSIKKYYEIMCVETRTAIKYVRVEAFGEEDARKKALKEINYCNPDDYHVNELAHILNEAIEDEETV